MHIPSLSARLVAGAVVGTVLGWCSAAHAGDIYWSVGVNSPGVVVGVSNGAPVYHYGAPPPVYYNAPPAVVYGPPPVVYGPPPVVYGPPPVIYAPPRVVYPAPPVVYMPPRFAGQPGWGAPLPQPGWGRPPPHRHHHGRGDGWRC